ncbi:MAG: L,D-transpeptidase [Phenylobacterium sp.]
MRTPTALMALVLSLALPSAAAAQSPAARRADLREEAASTAVRQVADWVTSSGDNQGQPFLIVDKVAAEVFVFDRNGRLDEASPALLGLARGDHSVPGIGTRKLSTITPAERTTPAGRFVASLGNDLGEKDIVWVDYETAISLHRVVTGNAKERRSERLATPTPLDNRISYGCINVPAKFYDAVVRPAFTGTNGVVYILPEMTSLESAFPAYAAARKSAQGVTVAAPAR